MEHNRVVAELEREKVATAERHDRVVRDLKGSYSDAEWAYSVETTPRDSGSTRDTAKSTQLQWNTCWILSFRSSRVGGWEHTQEKKYKPTVEQPRHRP